MSRRDRQRTEILLLAEQGEASRATALAHEHLAEFPDDAEVRRVVDRASTA